MSIGLNQANTVKASQMKRDRTKALKAMGAEPLDDGNDARKHRAKSAGKKAAERAKRARDVEALGELPCPMKTLLEAARAGDPEAMERATQLYGLSWRKR